MDPLKSRLQMSTPPHQSSGRCLLLTLPGQAATEEGKESVHGDAEADVCGTASTASTSLLERCKYIPLRLGHEERRLLRLLEAALNVSEYTDKVRCKVHAGGAGGGGTLAVR